MIYLLCFPFPGLERPFDEKCYKAFLAPNFNSFCSISISASFKWAFSPLSNICEQIRTIPKWSRPTRLHLKDETRVQKLGLNALAYYNQVTIKSQKSFYNFFFRLQKNCQSGVEKSDILSNATFCRRTFGQRWKLANHDNWPVMTAGQILLLVNYKKKPYIINLQIMTRGQFWQLVICDSWWFVTAGDLWQLVNYDSW